MKKAVLVVGGPGPPLLGGPRPEGSLVVAADSGLDRARALGLAVDVAVGDFDSVSAEALAAAQAAGVAIERHPSHKDATDLELALQVVRRAGVTHLVVIGGDSGRFDHTLANALLLASPEHADLEIEARFGEARVRVIRTRAELWGSPRELVSLLAVNGRAAGIVTEGLRYALDGEELLPGSSRGVSNEFVAERAVVSLTEGVLLAVQPSPTRPGE